ncbi:MAG: hypothetical protein ABIX01_15200 [Chitinophagaceae bacterium]
MTTLISKIQYSTFEPGEFIEVRERNYDETIRLIENFTWESQRKKINVDLTNPSVTIEGTNHDFLKLALTFNGKFVVHYIKSDDTLYTKTFVHLKDSYSYLFSYFSATFDTKDFKKENTLLQHNIKHFLSRSFRYEVNKRVAWNYLLSTSCINLLFSFFIIWFSVSWSLRPHPYQQPRCSQ